MPASAARPSERSQRAGSLDFEMSYSVCKRQKVISLLLKPPCSSNQTHLWAGASHSQSAVAGAWRREPASGWERSGKVL